MANGNRSGLSTAEYVLPGWAVPDATIRGDGARLVYASPLECPPHDVLVVYDTHDVSGRRWHAVCLCERDTTPQPTVEGALREARRHLHRWTGAESRWPLRVQVVIEPEW